MQIYKKNIALIFTPINNDLATVDKMFKVIMSVPEKRKLKIR